MEAVTNTDLLSIWLLKYGSFVIFILLSLGIIALPIPEETLMVIAGILMRQGKLNIPLTIFFAYAGTITGITVSYWLGRTAGFYLVNRYGGWFGITKPRLEKAHYWFGRLGRWLLLIGYFIPGIRHLTGFSAGTTYMKYPQFAVFAYWGAVMWVSLFLSLGYFLGHYCMECYEKLETLDLVLLAGLLVVISVVIFLIKRKKIKDNIPPEK